MEWVYGIPHSISPHCSSSSHCQKTNHFRRRRRLEEACNRAPNCWRVFVFFFSRFFLFQFLTPSLWCPWWFRCVLFCLLSELSLFPPPPVFYSCETFFVTLRATLHSFVCVCVCPCSPCYPPPICVHPTTISCNVMLSVCVTVTCHLKSSIQRGCSV